MWYYLDMISKIIFAALLISGFGIFWILNFTTPSSVGPIGVLGFFALAYIFFIGLITLFLYGVNRILNLVFSNIFKDKKFFSKKHELIFFCKYAAVLAFAPLILVAQQSIRNVGIFEIVIIVFLEIIACIYISKR